MIMGKSIERLTFLSDVLITAIEHAGHGFPGLVKWDLDMDREPMVTTATIVDQYAEGDSDRSVSEAVKIVVTLDTIAAGIGVIRKAELREVIGYPGSDPYSVLHNAATGARLFMSEETRKAILEASRTNDAGELDVVDALAILECALFGAVTYN